MATGKNVTSKCGPPRAFDSLPQPHGNDLCECESPVCHIPIPRQSLGEESNDAAGVSSCAKKERSNRAVLHEEDARILAMRKKREIPQGISKDGMVYCVPLTDSSADLQNRFVTLVEGSS